MMEQKHVFNVIWVDNDIDTLMDMNTKRILDKKGINIISAHNSIEFREVMEMSYDRIDAVITDANMPKFGNQPKNERDLSGFEDVKASIERYNQKRDIPFYLYSGRGDYLSERYENEGLEYFEYNQRVFSKGQISQLLEQLKNDVEHINSPSFRIRKKYNKELTAAAIIDDNENDLFDALLYDYSEDWKNTEGFFNPIRKIVERIFVQSKKNGVIPSSLSELNSFSNFLQGKDPYFEVKVGFDIMPKPLIHSLEYMLSITQDGSHGDGDLKLGVDKYVRKSKNINLFRTILYIAMDLCLWYEESCKIAIAEKMNKWQVKENCSFEYRGIINEIDGKMVCGSFLLHNKDNSYYVGDEVGIKLHKGKPITPNKHIFSYSENGHEIVVDKYAYPNNIIIIHKKLS